MFIVLPQVLFVHLLGIECFILLGILFLCWISLDSRELGLANSHVLFRVFLNFPLTFPSPVQRCFLCYVIESNQCEHTFILLCLCVCHSFRCVTITIENMTKIQIVCKELNKVESYKWNTNGMKTFSCSSDTKCCKSICKKWAQNVFDFIRKFRRSKTFFNQFKN